MHKRAFTVSDGSRKEVLTVGSRKWKEEKGQDVIQSRLLKDMSPIMQ